MALLRGATALSLTWAFAAAQSGMHPKTREAAAGDLSRDQLHALHTLMDRNKNGLVAVEEMLHFHIDTKEDSSYAQAQELFKQIDSNSDQKVTFDEIEMYANPEPPSDVAPEEHVGFEKRRHVHTAKFAMADKDKDDSLNSMEIVAFLFPDTDPRVAETQNTEIFKAFDTDSDGFLTVIEYLAGDHHDPADLEVTQLEEEEFNILDLNKDTKVDLKEFMIHHTGLFQAEHNFKVIMAHADRDGDQKVSLKELDDAYDSIKGFPELKHLKHAATHHEL